LEEEMGETEKSDAPEPESEAQETIPLSERGVDFIDDAPAPVDKLRPSLDAPEESAPSDAEGSGPPEGTSE
jgi:hypothetical protein